MHELPRRYVRGYIGKLGVHILSIRKRIGRWGGHVECVRGLRRWQVCNGRFELHQLRCRVVLSFHRRSRIKRLRELQRGNVLVGRGVDIVHRLQRRHLFDRGFLVVVGRLLWVSSGYLLVNYWRSSLDFLHVLCSRLLFPELRYVVCPELPQRHDRSGSSLRSRCC